jgi:benzoate-CoA ligase
MTIETQPQDLGTEFNFAHHIIDVNKHRPQKQAYIDDRGSLNYQQLAEKIRRTATALLDSGIRREERVLLVMQDSSDLPVMFLGAMYAGIVPVPINTLLTADDYAYVLKHSRAQALVISGNLLATLQEAIAQSQHDLKKIIVSSPSEPLTQNLVDFDAFIASATEAEQAAHTSPDDIGFWLYSSGSTGRPKGTVHTHANPYWTAEHYGKAILGINESDICFSAAKLFFAYGLGNALTFPLSVGATVILMAERATPDAVFKRWTTLKPTLFFGAPTGYAGMLASPSLPTKDEVALRMTSSAGEALPAEIGKSFTDHFGIEIIDGIGSTEMLHIYLSNSPGNVTYGTTGIPVPGYAIELRDDAGLPVADGEQGDLYVQGPSSALMYWNNRIKTNETFQGSWTKSGDKYIHNTDGTYTYAGRSDDMIKVSGIYVSPFEVEATLVQHPAVLEGAVIGVKDKDGLTKTKAFVVLQEGQSVTEEELKAFVKSRMAPYKYPRFIDFVAELPKTATGKIQRFQLRAGEVQYT